MNTIYLRTKVTFAVRIVIVWYLWLPPGQVHAWKYFGGDGVCQLESQGSHYVMRNGEKIAGTTFVFTYLSEDMFAGAELIKNRPRPARIKLMMSRHLPAGILHFAGKHPFMSDFSEGDTVLFKVDEEKFEGSIIQLRHDLTSNEFFHVFGDPAAAILEKFVEPSRLFNAALAGDVSARSKLKAVWEKGGASMLVIEAKSRRGDNIRVEIKEELGEQTYDMFMHCIETNGSIVPSRRDDEDRIFEKGSFSTWVLVPLFGSYVRIPAYCEIHDKESGPEKTAYICGRYGSAKNIVGSYVEIGSMNRAGIRYRDFVRKQKISETTQCGLTVYAYMMQGGLVYLVVNDKEYMKLQSVDRDGVQWLLQPICDLME